MTLEQKILATLANSTSRTPMDTEQVRAAVGTPIKVFTTLEQLRDRGKVGHCRIMRDDGTVDHWWLAGNVPPEQGYRSRGRSMARKR